MFETLDRLLLAGVGAMAMTREKAEQIFDDYVRRGQAERTQKARFVEDLLSSARKTRQEFEDMIARQIREVVGKLNIATKDDLARIEAKLDRLLTPTHTATE